jgi:hypothetical protein
MEQSHQLYTKHNTIFFKDLTSLKEFFTCIGYTLPNDDEGCIDDIWNITFFSSVIIHCASWSLFDTDPIPEDYLYYLRWDPIHFSTMIMDSDIHMEKVGKAFDDTILKFSLLYLWTTCDPSLE